MTDDILSKMDERKARKNVDRDKYNQLSKEIINDKQKKFGSISNVKK